MHKKIQANNDPASKPTRKPKQKRSLDRVETILNCAEQLITERGLADLRVHDVAALAGISPASIYQYFENSLAITEALAEKYFQELRTIVQKVDHFPLQNVDDLKDIFDLMWDEYYNFNVTNPAAAELLLSITADKRLAMLDEADTAEAVKVLVQGAQHLVAAPREVDLRHAIRLSVMLARETARIALKIEGDEAKRVVETGRRGMHAMILSLAKEPNN